MDNEEKIGFRRRINLAKQKRDKSWSRYSLPSYTHYDKLRRRISWIEERIIGPKILDVGCGPGIVCYLASKREDIVEIHGLDLQDDMITQARSNITSNKVSFHCEFAEHLPFENDYFDTVIMGEVLEHVFSEKEAVADAFRVLKPGGRIIVTVPSDGKLSFSHVRSFNKDSLTKLLELHFVIKEAINMDNFLVCVGERSR